MGFRVFKVLVYDKKCIMGGFACVLCMSRHQENQSEMRWSMILRMLLLLCFQRSMLGLLIHKQEAGILFLCKTGYVFVLNGGAVDWKSVKQSIFPTSSAEAKYISAFDASKEAVWVRKFIFGLRVVPTIEEPINMYCDNTGAIAIANDSGITKGARHFRAKVHYLQEVIEFGDIKLEKVHTYDNLADPFTKALAFPKKYEHTRNIGMLPASSLICHNIMSSDPNYQWEDLLDIDDSDLPLTLVLRPYNRHVRETITITSTQNTDGIVQVEEVKEKPVRIIPDPTGIVKLAKIRKQSDIHKGRDDFVLSTQKYIKQVVEDVGEDEDFNSESWVDATEYVKVNGGIVSGCLGDIKTFLKNGKLEQVVAIIMSCSLNALGDQKVTVKDLSGTLHGSIHYKVINEEGYGKEIAIRSAIILANVSDFVPGNGSGVGGSGILMEEEEIVKLVEKEEMADLELHVCGNVIDQEDLYKFDEEALDIVLEEEARESRAHREWLEKCR
uniref:Homologous recombination OB-fold protein OB-fold domain-containing protein n=1 Tax=Tanacetum cinerariifolium TaxID=118510 RepID=A0A6L2KSJ6_TANCI|nr:hypothetical protein [Tanacetum cinerariifolium]